MKEYIHKTYIVVLRRRYPIKKYIRAFYNGSLALSNKIAVRFIIKYWIGK